VTYDAGQPCCAEYGRLVKRIQELEANQNKASSASELIAELTTANADKALDMPTRDLAGRAACGKAYLIGLQVRQSVIALEAQLGTLTGMLNDALLEKTS